MDQRLVTLTLFALAVVVSGCTGGGGKKVQDQGDRAVTVSQLQVTPTEIFEGSTVRIRMGVTNSGSLPARVNLGISNQSGGGICESCKTVESGGSWERVVAGSQILTNHCPDIFDITSFSASSSNVSETRSSYYLAPDYSIRMNWELTQNSGNVPLNGYRCSLKFEVPFDYSVEAFKQLQVKANSEVQGSDELFAKSSKGPMKIEIQTIGSSAKRGAPTFLKGDNAEVLIQLENEKPDDSSYTGTVELKPPVMIARNLRFGKVEIPGDRVQVAKQIAARHPNLDKSSISAGDKVRMCPNPSDVPLSGDLRIYEGKSKVFRCDVNWTLRENGVSVPSLRGEIFARANYTYVKDVGSRTVRVRYSGS